MSKPKLKPKVMIEAVVEGKQLVVSFNLQDFKVKDNEEQKVLRAFVAMLSNVIGNITKPKE